MAQKARRIERAKVAGTGPLPTEKPCTQCGQSKPLLKFRKSKQTMDGRTTVCCACNARRVKAWRDTRREKERELDRARYQANPEKRRGSSIRWRAANPERHAAQFKARYHADPVKFIGHVNRRRMLALGVPGSHTAAEWKALCARFDYRCVCCGAHGPLTRDHIIPVTKPGARDSIDALQPLCRSCNSSKNNLQAIDYRDTPFTRTGKKVGQQ